MRLPLFLFGVFCFSFTCILAAQEALPHTLAHYTMPVFVPGQPVEDSSYVWSWDAWNTCQVQRNAGQPCFDPACQTNETIMQAISAARDANLPWLMEYVQNREQCMRARSWTGETLMDTVTRMQRELVKSAPDSPLAYNLASSRQLLESYVGMYRAQQDGLFAAQQSVLMHQCITSRAQIAQQFRQEGDALCDMSLFLYMRNLACLGLEQRKHMLFLDKRTIPALESEEFTERSNLQGSQKGAYCALTAHEREERTAIIDRENLYEQEVFARSILTDECDRTYEVLGKQSDDIHAYAKKRFDKRLRTKAKHIKRVQRKHFCKNEQHVRFDIEQRALRECAWLRARVLSMFFHEAVHNHYVRASELLMMHGVRARDCFEKNTQHVLKQAVWHDCQSGDEGESDASVPSLMNEHECAPRSNNRLIPKSKCSHGKKRSYSFLALMNRADLQLVRGLFWCVGKLYPCRSEERSRFWCAVKNRNLGVVKLLLEECGFPTSTPLWQTGDPDLDIHIGCTAECLLACTGDDDKKTGDMFALLNRYGAKGDTLGLYSGVTPLHEAILHGKLKLAQQMLDSGADLMRELYCGSTAHAKLKPDVLRALCVAYPKLLRAVRSPREKYYRPLFPLEYNVCRLGRIAKVWSDLDEWGKRALRPKVIGAVHRVHALMQASKTVAQWGNKDQKRYCHTSAQEEVAINALKIASQEIEAVPEPVFTNRTFRQIAHSQSQSVQSNAHRSYARGKARRGRR